MVLIMARFFRRIWAAFQPTPEPDPYDLSGPINNPRDQYIADTIEEAQARDAEEIER